MNNWFSVDDYSLLRAIDLVDDPSYLYATELSRDILGSELFEVVKENDHLRSLLRVYLEANIAVLQCKRKISDIESMSPFNRAVRQREMKLLKRELITLQEVRDNAEKPYNMLRKLCGADNNLLKRLSN